MTQPSHIRTRQELLGRPDDWIGELLAGIYEVDVEFAIYESMDPPQWQQWREQHPDQLEQMVKWIKDRLLDNLVIDAELDQYVTDADRQIKGVPQPDTA